MVIIINQTAKLLNFSYISKFPAPILKIVPPKIRPIAPSCEAVVRASLTNH